MLPAFGSKLSLRARVQLEQLGVIVRLNTLVTDVRQQGVMIRVGDHTEEIQAATLVWAAGVRASPLGKVRPRQPASSSIARAAFLWKGI